jgi:hypothetical protein
MKRALKITGWTLLGIVLTLVLIACIAIYLVFTPARLTPIARQAAAKYITCEHEIGEVDLTFFSTFPRFGLRADGLLLVNPKAGAKNDTVIAADRLTAIVDVRELIKHNNLHVHEAILENARVNFYIAEDGTHSFTDVFVSSPDTTEEDTAAFALPFDALRVDGLRIQAEYITFADAKDTIEASLGATELSAMAESWEDMLLALDAQCVNALVKNETYADNLHVELIVPAAVNLDSMHFSFDGAVVAVNDFSLRLEGDVTIGETIDIDAQLSSGKWQIQPLLALVPASFTAGLKDIRMDGVLQMDASVKGTLSDTQLPYIQAHVALAEGNGAYRPLPYELRDLELEADADLRLNKGEQSKVTIRRLAAQTKQSALSVKGTVNDLLGDMAMNLAMTLDANLPDWAYFLPEQMDLTGRAQGNLAANIRLSDLTSLQLENGTIDADLHLTDIHYAMDSMVADLPRTHARLQLPNPTPSKRKVQWVRIDMETDKVDFAMATPLTTAFQAASIQLESSNLLGTNPVIGASVKLQSNHPLEFAMDSCAATVTAPKITAYTEYNIQDTTAMPVLRATLDCKALNGWFKEIKADMQNAQVEASISGGRQKDKSTPMLRAKLNSQKADMSMGKELQAKTGVLAIEAGAFYKPEEENILLRWNPRLDVDLKNGELTLPERLPETVKIPSIEFGYSNREMTIENSRIELGNSDLNLKGNVRNIGRWFRHDTILEGTLDIVSDHCDANQLLTWFSADSGSEEKPAADKPEQPKEPVSTEQTNTETEPFLVPTDVDLALNTHIREVEIFEQVAKDLRGGLYVKDGKLILDEVGFVCHAAKLQLTAIYRTPRRNHLYMGLDYHMIDVKIDELLAMIPNLNEMVPMLSSFKGAAQFHLAAETYLNSQYQPKMSTLRGAASLTGKDMVVLDGETFSKISKMLMFNKKTENIIDSINAEITVYKNEIDIYPLCVSMDNYMVALGGRHKTDMSFDYDINVLKPVYLGVHVGGTMDDLQIKLAKCKFAKDFRPHWYQKADNQSLELRRMIKQSMEKNVRIK